MTMPTEWKGFVTGFLMAALWAVVLTACGSKQSSSSAAAANVSRAIPVNAATATVGSISLKTTYSATVASAEVVNLSPLATGRIERLFVDIGSQVKKGQVIAELGRGTLEIQLLQAEVNLREAQARLATLMASSGTSLSVARAQWAQPLPPISRLLPVPSLLPRATSTPLRRD